MQIIKKLFLYFVYLYLHNLLKINNLILEDNLLIQISGEDRKIDHGCHHICLRLVLVQVRLVELEKFALLLYISILILGLIMEFACQVCIFFFIFFFFLEFYIRFINFYFRAVRSFFIFYKIYFVFFKRNNMTIFI